MKDRRIDGVKSSHNYNLENNIFQVKMKKVIKNLLCSEGAMVSDYYSHAWCGNLFLLLPNHLFHETYYNKWSSFRFSYVHGEFFSAFSAFSTLDERQLFCAWKFQPEKPTGAKTMSTICYWCSGFNKQYFTEFKVAFPKVMRSTISHSILRFHFLEPKHKVRYFANDTELKTIFLHTIWQVASNFKVG